jgi:hypothetical protein
LVNPSHQSASTIFSDLVLDLDRIRVKCPSHQILIILILAIQPSGPAQLSGSQIDDILLAIAITEQELVVVIRLNVFASVKEDEFWIWVTALPFYAIECSVLTHDANHEVPDCVG